MLETLRAWAPPLLALLTVLAFDRSAARRGLSPPGLSDPARRIAFLVLLALVLAFGVFSGVASFGSGVAIDYASIPRVQLFLLHALFAVVLVAWYVLAFAGFPPSGASHRRELAAQLGLRSARLEVELGIGLFAGIAGWVAVLAAMLLVGLSVYAIGGEEALPASPPAAILWIAGLPAALRLALAVSAGLFEELFFRGFLQPRIGLLASTALFVLAHLSYDQPLMLVGITLLSLFYGGLVLWRQSLWAAIVAHAMFDAIQLLVVIPLALRYLPAAGGALP